MKRLTLSLALLTALLACSLPLPVPPTSPAPPPTDTMELPPAEPPTLPSGGETPISPPTPIPGWLTFHNDLVGYSFDYPPEASVTSGGVIGFPTEELPSGLSPSDYFATLEAAYPDDLCVMVSLPGAFLTLQSPAELGGEYASPCGISGIGAYDVVTSERTLMVGSTPFTANVTQLYQSGTEVLKGEFLILHLENGMRIDLGGEWEVSGSYEQYAADRDTLLMVLASFRWD